MPETLSDEYVCAVGDHMCHASKNIFRPIRDNPLYKQILASSVGSIVSTLAINPITVVKVKIQNVDPFAVSKTVRSTIATIIREKGFAGFYAGTPVGILMSVPNTVLYLSAYEEAKVVLYRRAGDDPAIAHLIPGQYCTSCVNYLPAHAMHRDIV